MLYHANSGYVDDHYLIVVSDNTVWRIPIAYCGRSHSCADCISLRDPHCAWDSQLEQCVVVNEHSG